MRAEPSGSFHSLWLDGAAGVSPKAPPKATSPGTDGLELSPTALLAWVIWGLSTHDLLSVGQSFFLLLWSILEIFWPPFL